MRLIDADELTDRLLNELRKIPGPFDKINGRQAANLIGKRIDEAPTVNVFQKLWNALYAEEDKFEKRYISTPEHDNWFLVYRPWLQDGFGIAIKVLSEIFVPEPPKEEEE